MGASQKKHAVQKIDSKSRNYVKNPGDNKTINSWRQRPTVQHDGLVDDLIYDSDTVVYEFEEPDTPASFSSKSSRVRWSQGRATAALEFEEPDTPATISSRSSRSSRLKFSQAPTAEDWEHFQKVTEQDWGETSTRTSMVSRGGVRFSRPGGGGKGPGSGGRNCVRNQGSLHDEMLNWRPRPSQVVTSRGRRISVQAW